MGHYLFEHIHILGKMSNVNRPPPPKTNPSHPPIACRPGYSLGVIEVRRTWEDLVREKGCRLKRGGGQEQVRKGEEQKWDMTRLEK